jgi:Bacterial HORMA domain family 1
MTDTNTDTFNPDDRRRVFAAFAADYRIVAGWTGLRTRAYVDRVIEQIKPFIEREYLSAIHLQLKTASGVVREAAVYHVSTSASTWSSDSPGDMYWDHFDGDFLHIHIEYSDAWWELPKDTRQAFRDEHIPDWGSSSLDGVYASLTAADDRQYSSGSYGMKRTHHS